MLTTIVRATFVAIIFAGISEVTGRTFSTILDYVISDPDSTTQGLIVKSERRPLRWGGGAYDVRYIYTVGDVEYSSSQVNYNVKTADAFKVLEKYPVDQQVPVYYDSARPQYATLEKRSLGLQVYGHLIAIGFSFLVALFVGLLARPDRR